MAFLVAVIVALDRGGPAFAQTAGAGYSTPAGVVQAAVADAPAVSSSTGVPSRVTKAASAADLPFTGLDVGLLLGAGVALLLTGGALSRLARSATSRTE